MAELSAKKLFFILALIAVFTIGVFLVDRLVRQEVVSGSVSGGESGAIRGVVSTLLPSGKVIVVTGDTGKETLLSLSEASAITNELGEDLFYTDVQVGMPISAAGIRGIEDNVVNPSLVTVRFTYASKGALYGRASSLAPKYFSVRYRESQWSPDPEAKRLTHKAVSGCTLDLSGTEPAVLAAWTRAETERKLGGNIIDDFRYTLKGIQMLRVITLTNPGAKYGYSGEGAEGPYIFSVDYGSEITAPALTECTRAVDEVVSSFVLRNASQNILVLLPKAPARVSAGEPFQISGRVRAYEGVVYATVVDESGRRLVHRAIPVTTPKGEAFGSFAAELLVPLSSPSKLALKVFQYSPASGAPIDLVQLPLSAP